MDDHVVLVVEDDRAIRELLTETLATDGFDVVDAADGAEALRLAEQPSLRNRLCMVLLDMQLPIVDGLFVLRRLEQSHPDLPIIAMSASSAHLKAAEKAGATATLAKPFELVDVLDAVDRHCKPQE